jgi:signal transduction histidine kinase
MDPQQTRRKAADWWVVETNTDRSLFRYRRLWISIVISTCLVSLIPLVVMVFINYSQYREAFQEEVEQPVFLLASSTSRSLQFYIDERVAVLDFIIRDIPYEELCDDARLSQVYRDLKANQEDIVDIGVIDNSGHQGYYVGPYDLRGKAYGSQEWFSEALLNGRAVSGVFLGHRKSPHFAIAVRGISDEGRPYLLRETLDAAVLLSIQEHPTPHRALDTFIINREGILQTPSLRHGVLLERARIEVPPPADEARVMEDPDERGRIRIIGYAYIEGTPFIHMVVEQRDTLLGSWFALRNQLIGFLFISVVLIVLVILAGASYMVNRIREADTQRMALLHNVEYTAKMASIGRLAAGVAHEINNPLAIINQKAGLMKDILAQNESIVDPILGSVDRCARITRRLLRFAKHIDIHPEPIRLELLVREVLGFLEKEADYRNLEISVDVQEGVPLIQSDRNRLQQVFLNIINNAFAAVEDGGRINIFIAREGDNHVSVTVRDNGVGIPEEMRRQIFEPFFTTKKKEGTGLGLSITYGLVEKLGGKITVDSQVGEWTKFTVTLPVVSEVRGAGDGGDAGPIGG